MPKISEVMNTDVLCVHADDTLEKAVSILRKEKISGLPVVDSQNRIIGVISDRDLLRYSEELQMMPFHYGWISPYEYLPIDDNLRKTADDFLKTSVSEVMSKRVYHVNEEDTLNDAVVLMKKKGVNRIPVADKDGKLKGIVTRTDLLNYLAEYKTLL